MRIGVTATALTAFVCLGLAIAPAVAEKWEDTRHGSWIDVDGLRKGADNVVFYRQKSKTSNYISKYAFDCTKRIAYYSTTPADWKSKGAKVIPGTMGEELLKFVCSRAR